MKILKNNYNKTDTKQKSSYPRKMICQYCNSELEYEESDLHMGIYGAMHLTCPCCNKENMLDEHEKSIVLTIDNIEFPTHFHHTSVSTGASDICSNEEIKKVIKDGINYFRKNKSNFAWFSECGNLFVAIYRYDNDDKSYDVIVTNDFYSTYIPFEKEDY